MAEIRVGTSGWTHSHWKGLVYPTGVQQRDWIAHYARSLAAVEVNATFYRPPQAKMLTGWANRTPADFLFALKAPRLITHQKRLKDAGESVTGFLARLDPLGAKAGPILFQLPPSLPGDRDRLRRFLDAIPAGWRCAFEFRDSTWHTDTVMADLAERNCAFVPFYLAGQTAPAVATADFVYVRLHGITDAYTGRYDEASLRSWADWLLAQCAAGRDGYIFFDNTEHGDDAFANACALADLVRG